MEISPLQILLADDDRDDHELFQAALEETSIHTQLTMVEAGDELMNLLTQKKCILPDILFLDLNMPRKTGRECLMEIKRNARLQSLPVIIYTQTVYPMLIEELYINGALYYIQKPDSFQKLAQVLKQVLSIPEEKKRVQPNKEDFVFHYVH